MRVLSVPHLCAMAVRPRSPLAYTAVNEPGAAMQNNLVFGNFVKAWDGEFTVDEIGIETSTTATLPSRPSNNRPSRTIRRMGGK